MKNFLKFLIIVFVTSIFNYNSIYAAGSSGGNESNYNTSFYKQGKKLVLRAKKLEKKNKKEKAEKIYLKALKKFEKAYAKDKKNSDILNYLGYTLRKTGDFKKAEKFYLMGLELDAGHLGINEYLGELYIQTNRIELAKKRLEVLNGCECEEYEELKELIENN
tara:strand:+ start:65 stop:553 length:489 start_codon:yes stop_codon:yes gene_type:complete